jgi:thioredoxin 1
MAKEETFMAAIQVTKENFNDVLASQVPVLVDFWAPWCGPCRMIAPVVEGISEEMGEKAVVGKINVDEQPELASRFGVMSIPTLAVFKEGRLTGSLVGVRSKQDILKLLEA